MNDSTPLRDQLEYYKARAAEYDQWWSRTGRYDRGAALNDQWFAEARAVEAALEKFKPAGRILEFACGTGIWTERLLPFATQLTALDGSSEMLALNAAKLRSPRVRYVEADLFQWQPAEKFDTIFFSFWLSHVPPEQFDNFWRLVRASLAPGGRVFFLDSRYEPTSTAINHQLPERTATVLRRKLNDGREFQIYKIFYEPADLISRLKKLGWHFTVEQTKNYFIYGFGNFEQA